MARNKNLFGKVIGMMHYILLFLMLHMGLGANLYLQDRLDPSDKRYASFEIALNLMEERGSKVLVETGTARDGNKNFSGDGGSTILFAHFASCHEAQLHTVDLSRYALRRAREYTLSYRKFVQFYCSDSVKFLAHFNKPIDFLYLDSFDFDKKNPLPSQEHHLKEIIAALPFLHEKSIVLIDDCGLDFGGKGALAIPFLLSNGWMIYFEGYQVLLVKEGSIVQ